MLARHYSKEKRGTTVLEYAANAEEIIPFRGCLSILKLAQRYNHNVIAQEQCAMKEKRFSMNAKTLAPRRGHCIQVTPSYPTHAFLTMSNVDRIPPYSSITLYPSGSLQALGIMHVLLIRITHTTRPVYGGTPVEDRVKLSYPAFSLHMGSAFLRLLRSAPP